MPRPVLIGIGGPVVGALVGQLGAVPGLAQRVALHLSPAAPGGRTPADPDALARAVVVLDEDGAIEAAERATLPPGCVVIALPRMAFASLWPDADIATDRAVRLDQWHEEAARALFRREAGCDIRIAAFVLSRFRHERLFHSATHPAGPVLLHVLAQLLGHPALLTLAQQPYDVALHAVADGLATVFAEVQVPVHPAVAAHFALNWWSPSTLGVTAQRRATLPVAPGLGDGAVMELHAAATVDRVAPFFATAIDPAIARHGADLLRAESGRYAAPASVLARLGAAMVLGHSGAVLCGGAVLGDTVPPGTNTWPAPDATTRRIAAPALLGFGPGWAEDPHSITGVLPRLLTFARLRRAEPGLVVLLPDALATAPWLRDMLALLGIAAAAVVWLDDAPAACAALAVTSRFPAEDVAPFAAAASRALAALVPLAPPPAQVDGPPPAMVYLRPDAADMPTNADAMEALLAARGFAVLDAGRTGLAARIGALRGAAAVVAPQSAVLAELAFCPPGASVLELVGPADPRKQFWSLASCAGLRYGYVVGEIDFATSGGYVVPLDMLGHALGMMPAPR